MERGNEIVHHRVIVSCREAHRRVAHGANRVGRGAWVVLVVLALLWVGPAAQAQAQNRVYVPTLMAINAPVGGSGEEPQECMLNDQEKAVLASLALHPDQRRAKVECHPILAQVARERAKDMAERDYFGHVNPDGKGPNYLVRAAGYALPSWYPRADDANNIESIAAGYSTPADVWAGWMNSSGHRMHLLGQHSFYAAQTQVGIGYYYKAGSRYGHYWVVLSAPPPDSLGVQDFPTE